MEEQQKAHRQGMEEQREAMEKQREVHRQSSETQQKLQQDLMTKMLETNKRRCTVM